MENLLDFKWDNESEFFSDANNSDNVGEKENTVENSDTFDFGVVEETAKTKETVKEEKNIKDTKDTKEKISDTKVSKEEDIFSDTNTEEVVISLKDTYSFLKENNFFKHVEIEESEDISEETFLQLQEEEYELEVEERLKSWASELDEDAKLFIQYKKEGGNTADFFEAVKKFSPKGDIEDEKYQDDIIRFQLKKEDWDSEEIEDRIEHLTNIGKKYDTAKRYQEKIEKEEQKEKERLLEANRKELEKREIAKENYINNIKSTLEKDQIVGFSLTPSDKKEIFNSLTKNVNNKKDNPTIFQEKLSKVFNDPEKLIILTHLINTDFDFKNLKNEVKTNTIKQVKKIISQPKPSSGSKHLADIFN